ncbi:ParB/RepB/Spo0J family partition protein [uncultured Brachyspira sp.]|mgnify:CR=1 FL=1|jgi:ParB/RepB/Spo0J family partition protein|uniref:ParB/RepB/Spo0J family partition protein n=1 Tax=uncultured Brachyspira sp. TaxID=221953 RepID=UPI002605AC94|nr:ParB/RepB/Spo0J family partition protein [uncultured Brachyspira sp.]
MDKENIKKMSSLLKNNITNNDKYQLIKLDDIELDENQPRKQFDAESINELSQSIIEYGVLTPISVSKIDENKFILRHGERRYRAAQLAGLEVIPAIIDNEYKENTLIKQLIENIQRESLTNDEISNAIKYLHYQEKMSLTDIAKALGKSNAYVSNYHAYATINEPLKEKLASKTSDILVISEINRISNKIMKNSNYKLMTLLNDSFYKFIDNNSTLNRDCINTLKEHLNSIEKKYLERLEYINNNPGITETVKEDDIEENNINTPAINENESVEITYEEDYKEVNEELTESFEENKEKEIKNEKAAAAKQTKQTPAPETNIIDIKDRLNARYIEIQDNNVFLINNDERTNLLTLNKLDEDKVNDVIILLKQLYKI